MIEEETIPKENEPTVQFAEVLNLSPEQEAHFKDLIAQNKGLIRVLVHPFYMNEDMREFIDPKTGNYITLGGMLYTKGLGPNEERYTKAVFELMQECSTQNIPLVIFEEANKIEGLSEIYRDVDLSNVMLVLTKRDAPYPYFTDDPEGMNCEASKTEKYNSDLEGVALIVKDLGAQRAIVGGSRLDLGKFSNDSYWYSPILRRPFKNMKGRPFSGKEVVAEGCVGYVGQALEKNGIETLFSNISGMTYLGYDFEESR